MKMKAAFLTGLKTIEIGEAEIPKIKENEVLIKVRAVGVCGSDVHYFEDGHIGATQVIYPHILGHEAAGEVVETGSAVKDLAVGDRVCMEPGIPCGKCEYCRSGRYNLCPDVIFRANPPDDGFLCEYAAMPADMCFKLPENMSFLEGALMEPFSVGLHSARLGNVCHPKTAAILGSGCIGLMTLQACRYLGASKIVVTDIYQKRLDMALELGADYVVNASETKDVPAAVKELIGEADVVFETAGSPVTTYQTSFIVKRGGCIVITGNPLGDIKFNFRNMTLREAELKAVWRYRNTYPTALQAVADGKLDLSKMKVDTFGFADTQKAFDTALNEKETTIKAAVLL